MALAGVVILVASCAANESVASVEAINAHYQELINTVFGFDDVDFARSDERELAIQSCMTREGFEYVPEQFPVITLGDSSLDDATFAAEWRFGISTYHQLTSVPPSRADLESLVDRRARTNADVVSELSVNEAEAWLSQLDGDDTSGVGGCAAAADEARRGAAVAAMDLQGLIEEHESSLQSNPQTLQSQADWVACMAEAGFNATHPGELMDQVWAEYNEIVRSAGGPTSTTLQVGEGQVIESESSPALDGTDLDRLEALQQTERAMAVTMHDCDVAFRTPEFLQMRARSESEFFAENQALVEQVLATAEG